MAIILTNAMLADIDPIHVEAGDLRIQGSRITARARGQSAPGDQVIDCGGAVVLPGLVNGHTHLYSALAVGMPAPPRQPRNFLEILQLVWWRLDRALDAESIEVSARVGALDALRAGTTTVIDHHASPNCVAGSLDLVERGLRDVGLRGVLCYEVTDRHGREGRQAGLDENRRYLHQSRAVRNGRFAGVVGAHAQFTLDDESLDAIAQTSLEYEAGIHIHVAEDACDEAACRRDHAMSLIDRLERHGLLRADAIFAHGTHLGDAAIARVNRTGLTIAHNPRSNMNNAVGYAPIASLKCPVSLGTDGIGGDMLAEAHAAWLKARDHRARVSPASIVAMLATSARRASASLGVTLGRLQSGACADIVVTDYVPVAPLTRENLPSHLIFGLGSRYVRHVMIDGSWCLWDWQASRLDECATRSAARDTTLKLWSRLPGIDS